MKRVVPALETGRISRLSGFGMSASADGYVYRPRSAELVAEVFEIARASGRKVVLRGTGLSYGDASILGEAIVLDVSRMDQVIAWDPQTGVIDAEAGVTIEGLWRTCLPDGWWPPVVSGTMFPTLAGALAMNIHGKNAYRVGPLGEHVLELEIVTTGGDRRVIGRGDPLFKAVISSAGLLAAIVRVKLQMKKVGSGDLRVLALSQPNWDAQFAAFEKYADEADYLVSWVDCFGKGSGAGRGLIHAAWYSGGPPDSLRAEHQDLPSKTLGVPKSEMWKLLRYFNNRAGMRLINAAKHWSARLIGNGKEHVQSLVAFNFLLDYVPNWRYAYKPGGFIQYQSFVPKAEAQRVFALQVAMQQAAGLESFLAVLKRHRPDEFLFSHAVGGYSLALDFKVTSANRRDLWALCHQMNDLVLGAGGRFYFAKDSTLRPEDVRAYLGEDAIERFHAVKSELDPDGVLASALGLRVELI